MPGEDGYDLLRKVRGLPAEFGGRVPAVALTAFARSGNRQRALLAGYQLHVAKPVEPSELITVCASLVDASVEIRGLVLFVTRSFSGRWRSH